MICKGHIICIGLVLLQLGAVHSKDSSEENRTDKRRPTSDNSISKENEKQEPPKSLDASSAGASASDASKPLSGSSDQLKTPPPSLLLPTEMPSTTAPPEPSPEPGPTPAPVPRPPHFTAGSFFIGFCVALVIVGLAFAAIRLFMRHRAEPRPYTMY